MGDCVKVLSGLADGCTMSLLVTHEVAHFSDEFHAVDGLDNVVNATAGVAGLNTVSFSFGCDHDDRYGASAMIAAQLAQRFESAHPRHDDIHKYQIGTAFERTRHAFDTIARHEQLVGFLGENHLFHLQ